MALHRTYQLQTDAYLQKAEYILEFEGKTFRLVRGTKQKLDKLCTIARTDQEDEESCEIALRLCDALSWQWGIGVKCLMGPGSGCPDDSRLEDLPINSFYSRTNRDRVMNLEPLKPPTTPEGRLALSLLNEARYSNSDFLSLINYWKVLELFPPNIPKRGSPTTRAIQWIDNQFTQRLVYVGDVIRTELTRTNLSLGNYLYKEYRNAIVHVTRKPTLNPSLPLHRELAWHASQIAEELAESYAKTYLLSQTNPSMPLKVLKNKKRTDAFKLLRYAPKLS